MSATAPLCRPLEGFRTLSDCVGAARAIQGYARRRITLLPRVVEIRRLPRSRLAGVAEYLALERPVESVAAIEFADGPAGPWEAAAGEYTLVDAEVWFTERPTEAWCRVTTELDGWGSFEELGATASAFAGRELTAAGPAALTESVAAGDVLEVGGSLVLVTAEPETSADNLIFTVRVGLEGTAAPAARVAAAVRRWEPPEDLVSIARILANRLALRGKRSEQQEGGRVPALLDGIDVLLDTYRAWPE